MANRQYDFTLPAGVGSSVLISVSGSNFKLLRSTMGRARVRTDQGDLADLYDGQGLKQRDGKTFREVVVTNLDAAANAGVLFIGEGEFTDERITGNVSIIDGAAAKTLTGSQFVGNAAKAAVPGLYSMVGLIVGTSKRVAIRKITVSSGVAGTVYWGFGNAAPPVAYSSNGSGISKSFNGAIAGSQASRWNATAANTPPISADVPGVQAVGNFSLAANGEYPLLQVADSPIVLQGLGSNIWFHSAAANRDLTAFFDFEEID